MVAMTEAQIRLSLFLGALALMMLWELAAPQRRQDIPRLLRWSNNLGLVVIDSLVLRLVFPVLAVALAESRTGGLFHLIDLAPWVEVLLALVILDFAIWAQHVTFHAVPWLWRLHRVHHADLELDATSGLRFHPAEILASMAIKLALVWVLGPPALAVLIFEIVLNASSIFNHANVVLPQGLDRVLRLVIVTPDMHRIHHSIDPAETHSNFGFNLPWWDRLAGTYRAAPALGQKGMVLGLPIFRRRRELWLDRLLTQPLRDDDRG